MIKHTWKINGSAHFALPKPLLTIVRYIYLPHSTLTFDNIWNINLKLLLLCLHFLLAMCNEVVSTGQGPIKIYRQSLGSHYKCINVSITGHWFRNFLHLWTTNTQLILKWWSLKRFFVAQICCTDGAQQCLGVFQSQSSRQWRGQWGSEWDNTTTGPCAADGGYTRRFTFAV